MYNCWMKKLLFCLFIFSSTALAQSPGLKYNDFCLICVDRLSVEAANILHKRDPYFPNREHSDWNNHAAILWNLTLMDHLYWDNNVFMDTDNSQVRHVGWEWNAGIDFGAFEIFHYHQSRHVMEESRERRNSDGTYVVDDYPLEDRYGIRINIIGGR